jgi:D-alanyl-D-alanine carboxypeptidase
MQRARFGTVAAFVVALSSAACLGKAAPPFDSALASSIDATVASDLMATGAVGVSVAVTRADGSSHTVTAGVASTETGRRVAAGDEFRIGSLTKTFMASITLQLANAGVLTLDDTIDQWVPGFSFGPGVTIRRCLNHTSGVYNYTNDPGFLAQSANPATPQQIIRFALSHGQDFEPGTQFEYSNTNFLLIGLMIEAVTGKAVADVLDERLLTPLDLNEAWLEGGRQVPSVGGYLNGTPPPPFDISWAWAAGGMDASAPDLCTWARDLYADNRVLPAASVEEMLTDTTLPNGQTTGYGLAVYLTTRGGRPVVGHTGSTMGFNVEMFFDRVHGDCVTVLTNDFFGNPLAVAEPVWELLKP